MMYYSATGLYTGVPNDLSGLRYNDHTHTNSRFAAGELDRQHGKCLGARTRIYTQVRRQTYQD